MEHRRRNALPPQELHRLYLPLQVRRADDEVGRVGEEQLAVDRLARAVVHQRRPVRHEAPLHAFADGDVHPPAGGQPDVGEGGEQHRHPLGALVQYHLGAGGVLKSIARPAGRLPSPPTAARRRRRSERTPAPGRAGAKSVSSASRAAFQMLLRGKVFPLLLQKPVGQQLRPARFQSRGARRYPRTARR